MSQAKYDLEDRLVNFSSAVIDVVEMLPATRSAKYIAKQLIRCGLSPALLYGEAQSAESRGDFIHKMKVGLKELKETRVCLKLIQRKKMVKILDPIAKENEELIAIIAKSIETAKKNRDAASILDS
ncbi:MAG TPA: four helix bundle protein [Chryseolinea sp.]